MRVRESKAIGFKVGDTEKSRWIRGFLQELDRLQVWVWEQIKRILAR